jgi:hypothetical protein
MSIYIEFDKAFSLNDLLNCGEGFRLHEHKAGDPQSRCVADEDDNYVWVQIDDDFNVISAEKYGNNDVSKFMAYVTVSGIKYRTDWDKDESWKDEW